MPTALITGAGRRIGAEFARTLAANGWRVLAHYNNSAGEAEALAAEIGGVAVQADLSDPDATAALIPRCIAAHGAIDALVNNASTFRFDTIESMTVQTWRTNLATNLEAPLLLAREFARAAPPEAAIVNVLDHKMAALNADFFSYTVAKAGLAAATRLLAVALAGRVRVNAIAPGLTLPSEKQTPAHFARAWNATPLCLSSTPGELAEALLLILATPSLNGETLLLDGGDHLAGRERDVSLDQAFSQ